MSQISKTKKRIMSLTAATAIAFTGLGVTAPAAQAWEGYGPIVNVEMGPYKYSQSCWAMYGISVAQGHVTFPCKKRPDGKWSFVIGRFFYRG